jgi:Ca2+-binding EF-hand superfamily protein
MIDVDGSKSIDKSETIKFWGKNFPKLNSAELFEQVDKNNDGTIQLKEWVEFWLCLLNSGYSENELNSHIDSLMTGGSWVKLESRK